MRYILLCHALGTIKVQGGMLLGFTHDKDNLCNV